MKLSDTEYNRLIENLFSKHPTVQKSGFSASAYKPGIEAMQEFAARLGNPQDAYRTIHVAGTNGKGSVSSMLAASLAAQGLRVGLYTSPHLLDFRERMRIIGEGMIEKDEVVDFLDRYDVSGLSFFEITTGMAFRWFADRKVDVAVIEVGLGGRLDSTNIITPELSVITSIGLDHCAMLGSTRTAIAAEKAGIMKPGVPAVVGFRDDETESVFIRKSLEVGCPLYFVDDGSPMDLTGFDLQGPCQEMNVRTVKAALTVLGVNYDRSVLERTAAITCFRGRWERLKDNPEVICDIGHNPPALKINFGRLVQSGRPLYIVYGVMADKDLDSIAGLMPAEAEYFLAAPEGERSLAVADLDRRLGELRPELKKSAYGSVAEAVRSAISTAAKVPNSLVYIGGSTFVVCEAMVCLSE